MNTLIRISLLALLILVFPGCNTADIDTSAGNRDFVQSLLTETRTTQYFSKETVSADDMISILDAGRNATSGMNMQPWHFSAITDRERIKDIASKMPKRALPPRPAGAKPEGAPMLPASSPKYPKAQFADAPAAIALSCPPNTEFNAGLACQNMVIAAEALGYGTKIVMGGAAPLNSPENRTLLGIPDNMNVLAILLVGKRNSTMDMTVDGVTGASTRKPLDEISTVIQN